MEPYRDQNGRVSGSLIIGESNCFEKEVMELKEISAKVQKSQRANCSFSELSKKT